MPDMVEYTAVRNGGKIMVPVPTQDETWIAALLADREAYIRTGNTHLIPGIDETLAFRGYEGPLPEYEIHTNGGQ